METSRTVELGYRAVEGLEREIFRWVIFRIFKEAKFKTDSLKSD